MKTLHPKLEDMKKVRKWLIVDASGLILGQLATEVAVRLRGKNKPVWHPAVDCGDNVIIINADKVVLTGKKEEQKMYHTHSGYPGALKSMNVKDMRKKHPERIVEKAVAGMIPRNRLKTHVLSKLYVYAGAEHPHAGQGPEPLTIK